MFAGTCENSNFMGLFKNKSTQIITLHPHQPFVIGLRADRCTYWPQPEGSHICPRARCTPSVQEHGLVSIINAPTTRMCLRHDSQLQLSSRTVELSNLAVIWQNCCRTCRTVELKWQFRVHFGPHYHDWCVWTWWTPNPCGLRQRNYILWWWWLFEILW